ncbi:MAG: hypothetical protein KGL75_08665 [Acidobacteriota bacterium]|nr:hypothetical protein [Acidobacteriota bacterium]
MRVHVTWQDILEGRAMRTTACMVALALKRELGVEYASVGLRDARIRLDGRYVTLRLPGEVGEKIRFWEKFHFVFPFSFEFPGLIGSALVEPARARRTSFGALVATEAVL